MSDYQHILLATSLADHAGTVAARAKMLADEQTAKLSIVHVIEHTALIHGSGEYSIPIDHGIEAELTHAASESLVNFANQLGIAESDQFLLHGNTKLAIIDLADELEADLIVVGTHARQGAELMLGSTANAVLHAAKCDVYAVNTR